MAIARKADFPPLPPHLRHLRVSDFMPWPIPRQASHHPARRSPEMDGSGCETSAQRASPPGDESLARIYRAETPGLLRFFRRRLASPDEAHDLTHETIARFIRATPSAGITTPQAYLRRIATNLLRDRAERGSTRLTLVSVPLEEALDISADDDPHRALEARQELQHWQRILNQLPARTREVFLLCRVDGYTYQEVADHLGISTWIVKRQMAKALAHVAHNRRRPR